jgi:hypothetical protein
MSGWGDGSGLAECQQLAAKGDPVGVCIGHVIAGTGKTGAGQGACLHATNYAGDANLSDCLLGLSGQSYFGGTSCKLYYGSH